MEISVNNKVVVITGGAQGIGRGIAEQFLLHDAKVTILLDLNEVQGDKTLKDLKDKHGEERVEFIKCDVTTDVERVTKIIFDKYNTVDVAVMSAGIADASISKIIDINLTATIEWSTKFIEHMRKDTGGNGGTIITISSIFGFRSQPYGPVYQATKFGVVGFTKSIGHINNFNKTGVRVIALCPGFTDTPFCLNLRDPELKKTQPEDLLKFVHSFPWQTAEDVGIAAVEAYKRAASGTVWLIEGGKPITEVP